MATSGLTVRTLAMATVALVLACAKAVVGQSGAPVPGSNVGTLASSGASSSRSIVTVSSRAGAAGSSILTVSGEKKRLITQAAAQPGARPNQPRRPQAPVNPAPAVVAHAMRSGVSAPSRHEPMVVIRRVVIGGDPTPATVEPPEPAKEPPPSDPRIRAALEVGAAPAALPRNAFSLGMGGVSPP